MDKKSPFCAPEIWGGIECTINRVEDVYKDQLEASGHYARNGDIDDIAQLGVKALRYPVLWEYHQPQKNKRINWNWIEDQLNLIRTKNITPIAGLVHHGSGPAYTNLYDPVFAEQLAGYAKQVASKFPGLDYYTPVNEPLTTARFSGLYGYWYPHYSDDHSFAVMLLNQVKATVLSMQAIRKINPAAKLVQTEDLAKIHSTALLQYQADFENERRWITYDLLCGKVNRDHSFWNYFLSAGIPENDLEFFIENICVPDIIGLNYYVTSERYIDENITQYPPCTHGGNGRHTYADTEAVRAGDATPAGFKKLVKEAWERYQLPIAITEAHLSCSREEQMRWFKEIWDESCALKKEGVDLKAVTAWSLLGACDWNSLLTQNNHHYETGVFNVHNNKLQPTATAKLIKELNDHGDYHHPLLQQKGWWHNPENTTDESFFQPLLIIGKTGTLGNAFVRICIKRNIPFIALTRKDINILSKESIDGVIELYKPWAVINSTGYVNVEEAELNIEECYAVNATAPELISQACKIFGIPFMTFSSDLVFNGIKRSPYFEDDVVQPLNIYGKSKSAGEAATMRANPGSLIIRTSAFFGPWDKANFVYEILQANHSRQPCRVLSDVVVSPTYVPDLVNSALDLLIDGQKGIWHISNEGSLSWRDFAYEIAGIAGMETKNLQPKKLSQMQLKANRPVYSVLQSERRAPLPTIENALKRYFGETVY